MPSPGLLSRLPDKAGEATTLGIWIPDTGDRRCDNVFSSYPYRPSSAFYM